MYFYKLIKKRLKENNIIIFLDMDGVISDYEFGQVLDFGNKRPIQTTIDIMRKITELDNVEIQILSIARKKNEIEEKKKWLEANADFLTNINIIDKESNNGKKSKELKLEFINNFNSNNKKVILIDDDHSILEYVNKLNNKNIDVYHVSSIID